MTTLERSGWVKVVVNSSITSTCPCTPTISTYSPTRNGLVKMMVNPATKLLSTPCVARPTPTQGVLSNLVAGLTIIFTKPFRVGEYVEMVGVQGQVEVIELFTTTLTHPDRSKVVIPNRKIVGEVLHNYGTIRQLDMSVGVAYDTNLPDAIAILRD